MDEAERDYLEKLIKLKRRRLQILEEKQAGMGISTAPEIIMEIEDLVEEMAQLHERLNRASAVAVELDTYADSGPRATGVKQLSWATHFQSALPTPETWNSLLLPELQRLRQKIGREYRDAAIALRPKAHLSAGFAFGYVFRARAGIRLWIEQRYEEDRVEWWRASEKTPSIKGSLLDAEIIDTPGLNDDAIMELCISRHIGAAIDQWLKSEGREVGQRIRLIPDAGSSGDAVPDAAHALAMARQVSKAIKAVRDQHPTGTIHLFGALPFALAVMIGMRLNACEPIQCYEYQRPENIYVPSCRLVPTIT
jgi:hypothetical protein